MSLLIFPRMYLVNKILAKKKHAPHSMVAVVPPGIAFVTYDKRH